MPSEPRDLSHPEPAGLFIGKSVSEDIQPRFADDELKGKTPNPSITTAIPARQAKLLRQLFQRVKGVLVMIR